MSVRGEDVRDNDRVTRIALLQIDVTDAKTGEAINFSGLTVPTPQYNPRRMWNAWSPGVNGSYKLGQKWWFGGRAYHNWEDQNTGTSIISSQRMFAALQGLGKNAVLFEYPYEDHSVGAYASDLDQWARWLAWFDIYVKNAKVQKLPQP